MPSLLDLPSELLAAIAVYLPPRERLALASVARRLRAVVHGSAVDWLRASGVLAPRMRDATSDELHAYAAFGGGLYAAMCRAGGVCVYVNAVAGRIDYLYTPSMCLVDLNEQPRPCVLAYGDYMPTELLAEACRRPERLTAALARMPTAYYRLRQAVADVARQTAPTTARLSIADLYERARRALDRPTAPAAL